MDQLVNCPRRNFNNFIPLIIIGFLNLGEKFGLLVVQSGFLTAYFSSFTLLGLGALSRKLDV